MYFLRKFVPQAIKNWYHLTIAMFAALWFGFPGKKLRVIGVTGTDGKTTTCRFLADILREAGHEVALASSIEFRIGAESAVNATKFTTLSAWRMQEFLSKAVRNGCGYAVLEVSSHALDQQRVWGIPFSSAVITNVTREHLDYHRDMVRYRRAKRRLFERAVSGVVNLDMESPEEFLNAIRGKRLTYSLENPQADVFAERIETRLDGSNFLVDGVSFSLRVPGRFNIENALAALSASFVFSVSLEDARRALSRVEVVPGRMELVPNDHGISLLIDYAVTPNALEKLYSLVVAMKPRPHAKIIAVFGACGDRDRGKRPLMGEIVSSYADTIILTNEDPYTEDPEQILREIRKGIVNKVLDETLFVIPDRRCAIQKAICLAGSDDIIVVSGKGAEETMAVGSECIPWNDKRVILEVLEEIRRNQ